MKINEIDYCDKCENEIRADINPDRALYLTLEGGYAMFMDLKTFDLIFCHKCAVEFFRTIPSLSQDKANGLHSVSYKDDDYPLCCEYAWTFENDETILGTKEHFDKKDK
jgi:hypothetical protein